MSLRGTWDHKGRREFSAISAARSVCVESHTFDKVHVLPELSRLEVRRCFAHAHLHETTS